MSSETDSGPAGYVAAERAAALHELVARGRPDAAAVAASLGPDAAAYLEDVKAHGLPDPSTLPSTRAETIAPPTEYLDRSAEEGAQDEEGAARYPSLDEVKARRKDAGSRESTEMHAYLASADAGAPANDDGAHASDDPPEEPAPQRPGLLARARAWVRNLTGGGEPQSAAAGGEPSSAAETSGGAGATASTSTTDATAAAAAPKAVSAEVVKARAVDPRRPLGDLDFHLFSEGTHMRLWERLGALPAPDGSGTHFALWAPNARHVSVIGEWNAWSPFADPLKRHPSGVWTGFVAGAQRGMIYKYRVIGLRGEVLDKADPHALLAEMPPQTASVIWDLEYAWSDGAWMASRGEKQRRDQPMSIYEVHLGSWQRGPQGEFLSYRELAPRLIEHVQRLGFTHVELMPVSEHPFFGSWGYQPSAYYAPTRRYGTPQDLMAMIDALHQAGIGVLLDWVPAHFPADAHSLARFDGTYLYEHADPRRGIHPDWNTLIFNLARHEVQSFLISAAMMWLQAYHIDGLRVDAVASMLYLDYSRKEGQWVPNHLGGRENLEAIHFLRQLNRAVHQHAPGAITIAEESTAWPLVSHPVESGGLGFDFKWDMGWMHDTLRYFARDPLFRKGNHNDLTFRMMYAYAERFVLPLSHDEVVHGKGSLPIKMAPGSGGMPQRLASLRTLYAWMFGMPGKKLLFMGAEFGQVREWNHDRALDWQLLEDPAHAGVLRWVERLGHLHRDEPALHELDHDPVGFQWSVVDDNVRSTVAFFRRPRAGSVLLFVINFTPVTWSDYRVGLPAESEWTLVASSDAADFGGQGRAAAATLRGERGEVAGHPCSARLDLPPMTALVYRGPDIATLEQSSAALQSALAAEEAEAEAAAAAEAAEAAEAAKAPRVVELAAPIARGPGDTLRAPSSPTAAAGPGGYCNGDPEGSSEL